MTRVRVAHRDRRSHKAARRAVGAGTAVGAFLALGMTPLAAAPPANADFGFDDLIDLFDPGAFAAAAPDLSILDGLLGDFAIPSSWDALVGAHTSLLSDVSSAAAVVSRLPNR
ncbi:MAG: hypothetical protein ACRDTV_12230 [Mycobacterium sp.]